MHRYALSAIGTDRPGIVARITATLLDHGLNIEDSQATILRGHFSIVLIVSAVDPADRGRLDSDLERVAAELGLEAVSLTGVEDAGRGPEPSHMVTVYGADHPGIVHAATTAIAKQGVDITDLNTRLIEDDGEEPLYALMMEVALPSDVGAGAFDDALAAVGKSEGVEVSVSELERDDLQVAVREVLRYPNPLLKAVCAAPDPAQLTRAERDLLDTMDSFDHCVGLAAPQLGQLVRVIAVDVSGHPKAPESANGRLLLADPVVAEADGAEVAREGCLSIPHLTANVRRATRIVVEAGDGRRVASEGFEARCLLHEIDHLDGVLFLDRVDSLGTDVFRRKRYR